MLKITARFDLKEIDGESIDEGNFWIVIFDRNKTSAVILSTMTHTL